VTATADKPSQGRRKNGERPRADAPAHTTTGPPLVEHEKEFDVNSHISGQLAQVMLEERLSAAERRSRALNSERNEAATNQRRQRRLRPSRPAPGRRDPALGRRAS